MKERKLQLLLEAVKKYLNAGYDASGLIVERYEEDSMLDIMYYYQGRRDCLECNIVPMYALDEESMTAELDKLGVGYCL